MLTIRQAAKIKRVSKTAILHATRRGVLNAQRVGHFIVVADDTKFAIYKPLRDARARMAHARAARTAVRR